MGFPTQQMLVYKCIESDAEFLTDASDFEELYGGCVVKVPAKYITVGGEEDIDIGANASAEEVAEELGGDTEQAIDMVYNFRLQPMEYKKKEYMAYMKSFCKKIVQYKKSNPDNKSEEEVAEDVQNFKSNVQEALKAITAEWDEYCCFVDEDFNCEASTVLCRYDADGVPSMYYFIDGFKQVKY